MSFEVTLLVFGILLFLVGLVGKVKAKELEVGTSSKTARVIIAIAGLVLITLSFNPDLVKNVLSTSQEHTDTDIHGDGKNMDREDDQERSTEEEHLRAEEEARRRAEDEAHQRALEETRRRTEEETRLRVEEEARQKAEAEARERAEAEEREKAAALARRKAAADARRKAVTDARERAEKASTSHPCEPIRVPEDATCSDFYAERKNWDMGKIRQCGWYQVGRYKEALNIRSQGEWEHFLSSCK